MLRARQLCGLKFRRQHPIGPWIADFACVDRMLVVEIDGEYHDKTPDKDIQRQNDLQGRGWTVIRFSAEDVENDAESVCRAIANKLGLPYDSSSKFQVARVGGVLRYETTGILPASQRLGCTTFELGTLNLELLYEFKTRLATGSGMRSVRAPSKRTPNKQ